ncbi:DUF2600 family protein, partial [Nostoc sp. FACHB-888]|nr:DUF2600 family protein [Nostoc sp. FACHB-888]
MLMLIDQDHNPNKNIKDFLPKALLLQVPSSSTMLMLRIYYDVIPRVHKHLEFWKKKAELIPNVELRKQALLSINTKAFHCEGGSIYGLLAKQEIEQIICFIVAYQ